MILPLHKRRGDGRAVRFPQRKSDGPESFPAQRVPENPAAYPVFRSATAPAGKCAMITVQSLRIL